MNNESHVLLKKTPRKAGQFSKRNIPDNVYSANLGLYSHYSVDSKDLDPESIASLKNNRDVFVGRNVPIKLISPYGSSSLSDSTKSWGLEITKADMSFFTGKGIKVAILDSGIDKRHEAFSKINILEKDFTGEGDGDQNGHGTHCAGIIAGGTVQSARIGVAPKIDCLLIGKVLDRFGHGSTKMILDAMIWAVDHGANIISISLGIDYPGFVNNLVNEGKPPGVAVSIALQEYRNTIRIFETLISHFDELQIGNLIQPLFVIAAAGNESRRDISEDFVISVSPPAACKGVISVGAVGIDHGKIFIAPWSNIDPFIVAPGVNIWSAKLNGGLYPDSGTSMAAPYVAGIAALWMEKLNSEKPWKKSSLLSALEFNAKKDLFSKAQLSEIGAGLVMAP